ncbi:flagellar hook-length control protein FliK [Hydrogenophaga sp. PAMC20947]|uniref:flagellar hook-length control protein FliK n=1 Tax=Hydrogenophaga sp. PAMC20947 TaxID=2565558 RepID=UPI00109DCD0E|nr:flagellar hook-length control protein FliK [Hydrogenophaga sp. PAMC20947]QCB46826.1 flagellar hook-length control protein FliK [Hydrogenophaga sp. PAMC20947]
MSNTTASAGANRASGSNQASATKSPSSNASRADKAAQTPTDMFASLLGLLSATRDARLNADGTEATALGAANPDDDAGSGETADLSSNPLAALLGWPGAPVLQADLPRNGEPLGGADKRTLDASAGLGNPSTALGTAADSALKTSGAGPEGIDLQGMTLLDQPEEAGAELKASLTAATQGSDSHRTTAGNSARADASAFASRPANWRSTTALAHNAASATSATLSAAPTTTTQIQLGQAAQVRVAVDTALPASRSTLNLDERFSASNLGEGSSPLAGLGTHGQATSQGGSDQPPPGSAAFAEALTTERSESGANDGEFTLTPETPAEEPLPEETAMSPHQLRHASLRIGEGTEEAIDIQLALRGEQLNVDFRTDNSEARASLQQNASGALADLLQRGGIQLGQVSVGAQNQGQERQGQGQAGPRSAGASAVGRTGASGLDRAGAGAPGPQAPARRSDGSRPLDLFV